MLTLPLTTVTSSLVVDTITVTATQISSFRFPQLCTLFDHDASQDTFNGPAQIISFPHLLALSGTSTAQDSTGLPRVMDLRVASATFDTAAGTGACQLTAGFTSFSGLVEGEFTSVEITFELDPLSLADTTEVLGTIACEATFHGATTLVRSADPRPFSLLVGTSCS